MIKVGNVSQEQISIINVNHYVILCTFEIFLNHEILKGLTIRLSLVAAESLLAQACPRACIIKLITAVINSITLKASVFVKASKK